MRALVLAGVVICSTWLMDVPLAAQVVTAADGAVTETKKEETARPAPGAPRLNIDLAHGTWQEWPIQAGTYSLTLVHTIPGQRYSIIVGGTVSAEITVLTLPAGTPGGGVVSLGDAPQAPCQAGIDAASALLKTQDETHVPQLLGNLQQGILVCPNATIVKQLQTIANGTVTDFEVSAQIPDDSLKTISIVRGGSPAWTIKLSTLSRGAWQTVFGWTVAPNRDEDYFSESAGDDTFTIKRRARDKGSLTSLPSIFFTWLPTSQAFRSLQHGFTAGVGATVGSSARPAFFGGYMLRWNQNIGVVAGLALYPHRRLDGKYAEGQTIPTNLESDQLNRNALRPNAFFGGVLRFGSDPRKAPEEKKAEEKTDTTKK